METDGQIPGEGGAGEAVEPTEPTVTPTGEPTEPNGDPLDDIKDPVAREEAKKFRAIARRNAKKDEPKAPDQQPVQGDFAKKDDIARLVTSQAKELVSAEVRDAWDDLLKIPLSGYDPLDSRSIAKNMTERLALHKLRTGNKPVDPLKDLQITSGAGTAPVNTGAQPVKEPPRFSLPTQPDSWYKKKE